MRPARPSRRRGANAIEFALTLPFFLTLVLGMMDYGYLFAVQAGINNAVSLACREGAMADPDLETPEARAEIEWQKRSGMFCGGANACDLEVESLLTGQFAYPNQALRCHAVRMIKPLSGFVPYPATVESVSYYRLEWQQIDQD